MELYEQRKAQAPAELLMQNPSGDSLHRLNVLGKLAETLERTDA